MVCEKYEYYLSRKRQNYEINGILWKSKAEVMQHALKVQ
jgi:hypothetical protein